MPSGDRRNADTVLITALAGGATVAAAAEQAGVSERTTWRRLQDEGFRRRLDTAREQTVQTAVDTLSRGSTRAARTLVALMSRRQEPRVRLAAARSILQLGMKARELEDLEERIAALEERLTAPPRRRRG